MSASDTSQSKSKTSLAPIQTHNSSMIFPANKDGVHMVLSRSSQVFYNKKLKKNISHWAKKQNLWVLTQSIS